MTTRYLPAVVLLTAVVLAAFLIGRYRTGDLQWRVDGVVALGTLGLGAAGFAMTAGPPALATIGLPAVLAACGAYLVVGGFSGGELAATDRPQLVRIGAAALILGLVGVALGLLRFWL